MPILTLIIGLERSYRGAPLTEQLEAIGVHYERSPGVEGTFQGRNVREFTDDSIAAALFGRALTTGEVGCALAHRVAYQRLLDSTAEWALVFEDDARVVRPADMAAIYSRFEGLGAYGRPAIFALYGRQVTAQPSEAGTIGGVKIRELIRPPMTATGYFINRAAAQHILDTGIPLRNPADWPVSVAGNVQFAAAWPWPVVPEEVEVNSSIGVRNAGDRQGAAKIINRLYALAGLKWFSNRSDYRSLREYHEWEIRRRVVEGAIGSGHPYRVPDDATDLPQARPVAVVADRLLGGARPGAFLEYIMSGASLQ